MMKKTMPVVALAMLFLTGWGLCSCQKNRAVVAMEDPLQDDSVALALADSMMRASQQDAENDSTEWANKKFTEQYVNIRASEVYSEDSCFSSEYKRLRKELGDLARQLKVDGIYFDDQDYNIWFGGNDECGPVTYRLETLRMLSHDRAEARFMAHNCEDYPTTIQLVYENGDWFVDDISNEYTPSFKAKMKRLIENKFQEEE